MLFILIINFQNKEKKNILFQTNSEFYRKNKKKDKNKIKSQQKILKKNKQKSRHQPISNAESVLNRIKKVYFSILLFNLSII